MIVCGGAVNVALQQVEEVLGPLAPEGIDALTGQASSTSLEAEQIVFVAIATEALEGPFGRFFALAVECHLIQGDFNVAAPEFDSVIVNVHHAEDGGMLVIYVPLAAYAPHVTGGATAAALGVLKSGVNQKIY